MLSFAPIVILVRFWGGYGANVLTRLAWRLTSAFLVAAIYAGGPFLLARVIELKPLVPVPPRNAETFFTFFTVLVVLASIFIGLAAQQASYVTRLDELRNKRRLNPSKEITAAYSLVSYGFWAFSCGVPTILGHIAVYLFWPDLHPPVYGVYQGVIAAVFIGGWLVLMAGALRRFETIPQDGICKLQAGQRLTISTSEGFSEHGMVFTSHSEGVGIETESNRRIDIVIDREEK